MDAIGVGGLRALSGGRVCNWRARGVPWTHRPAVARLAEEVGITLPSQCRDPPVIRPRSRS